MELSLLMFEKKLKNCIFFRYFFNLNESNLILKLKGYNKFFCSFSTVCCHIIYSSGFDEIWPQ